MQETTRAVEPEPAYAEVQHDFLRFYRLTP
jgi:hypothetical protein